MRILQIEHSCERGFDMGIGAGVSGWLVVVGILLGGGGGDLLDCLSTNDYWQSRKVEPAGPALMAMLTADPGGDPGPLIAQLGAAGHDERQAAQAKLSAMGPAILPVLKKFVDAPDPEVRVRVRELIGQFEGKAGNKAVQRLMAIRTLGELKHAAALPLLKTLTESKMAFEAEYARRAIAAIEGKPFKVESPDKALDGDVWLLPGNCAMVYQVRLAGAKPAKLDDLIDPMAMGGMFGGAAEGADPRARARDELLKAVDRIGNVRVHGVTLGMTDNIGNDTGSITAVVRGTFDRGAIRAALLDLGCKAEKIGRAEVLRYKSVLAVIFESDERAVVLGGPNAEQLPVKETIAALEAGKGKLAENAAMVALVGKVEHAGPMWGVAQVPAAAANEPIVGGFKTAVLSSRRQEGRIDFAAKAEGTDAEQVAKAVEEANAKLAEAMQSMDQAGMMEGMFPGFKPWLDAFKSIRLTADGAAATGTAQFKGDLADMVKPYLSLVLMMSQFEGNDPGPMFEEGEGVVPFEPLPAEEGLFPNPPPPPEQ